MARVTHKHIERATAALNERRGLTHGQPGYLIYADIRGDGIYRPDFYVYSVRGGLTNLSSNYRYRTMRATLENLERLDR